MPTNDKFWVWMQQQRYRPHLDDEPMEPEGLPDWLDGNPEDGYMAECRRCGEWFEWHADWGLTDDDYEGAYCGSGHGGAFHCSP